MMMGISLSLSFFIYISAKGLTAWLLIGVINLHETIWPELSYERRAICLCGANILSKYDPSTERLVAWWCLRFRWADEEGEEDGLVDFRFYEREKKQD